jgi:hypothetical protein
MISRENSVAREDFIWQYIEIDSWPLIQTELDLLPGLVDIAWDFENHGFKWSNRPEYFAPLLPVLWTWFDQKGLEPAKVGVLDKVAGQAVGYHVDLGPYELALQLPIKNCNDQTYTGFYISDGPPTIKSSPRVSEPNCYDPLRLTEIARYTLDKPLIFNVKKIHGVHNLTSRTRTCLSIRFRQNPWKLINL